MRWLVPGLVLLALFSTANRSVCVEKVRLKADRLYYAEKNRFLVASSNAALRYNDFSITGDRFVLDTEKNMVWGTGNILITQGDREIGASRFHLNIDKNTFTAEDIRLKTSPFSNTQNIYIVAAQLSDNGKKQYGKRASLTTCDAIPPHYHVDADTFSYYPDQRLVGQNVMFYNPIFFIPFSLWSPTYVFELGKRKIVYLMPQMGSNRVEGGFFKSTFDYYFEDGNSGQFYTDAISTKGFGLGIKHNYLPQQYGQGFLYYYAIPGQPDNSKEWDQTLTVSDTSKLRTRLKSSNSYLLSGGRAERNYQNLGYKIDTLGDKNEFAYSMVQNNVAGSQSRQMGLNYDQTYNDRKLWSVHYNKQETSLSAEDLTVEEDHMLSNDYELQNTFFLQRNQVGRLYDESLKTTTIVTKRMPELGTFRSEVSLFFDPDRDLVTADVNTYVKKLPELTFTANPQTWQNISLQTKVMAGNYEEAFLSPVTGRARVFQAGRYVLNQQASTQFSNMPLNGTLGLTTGYEQFAYTTGDQVYKLDYGASYRTDWWNFFQTNTRYSRSIVPNEGNSPFFFDERNQLDINQGLETFTFYWDSVTQYKWDISTGYDFQRKEQLDYRSEINVQPDPRFRLNFRSGYRIKLVRYDPLDSLLTYRIGQTFYLAAQASYDLNAGRLTTLTNTIRQQFGTTWEDRWLVDANFIYQPLISPDYRLQSIAITKDMHCRKITFLYDRLLEEYRVKFTMDAFPEDTVGFATNKIESFRLEGVFDNASTERF